MFGGTDVHTADRDCYGYNLVQLLAEYCIGASILWSCRSSRRVDPTEHRLLRCSAAVRILCASLRAEQQEEQEKPAAPCLHVKRGRHSKVTPMHCNHPKIIELKRHFLESTAMGGRSWNWNPIVILKVHYSSLLFLMDLVPRRKIIPKTATIILKEINVTNGW